MEVIRYKSNIIVLLLLILAGCTEPIPDEKKEYIGSWYGESITLVISANGVVEYQIEDKDTKTTTKAPLKKFIENAFEVGIWFLTTRFEVNEPPQEVNGLWSMVVNNIQLIKNEAHLTSN